MIMPTPSRKLDARRHGVAAVEFALIASLFFTAFFGAIEMARLLYIWNTAVEATRAGARMAVVCDNSGATLAAIRAKVRSLVPMLTDAEVTVSYQPGDGCSADCTSATVRITSTAQVQTYIPLVPLSLTLPSASTSLPRESMASSIGGGSNPVCQ